MARKNKKKKTLAFKNAVAGYLFIAPFIIGFILFLVVPLVQSLRMSFSTVELEGGLSMTWAGLENYRQAFLVDEQFVPNLISELVKMLTNVPATLIFSFFIALLLNQRKRSSSCDILPAGYSFIRCYRWSGKRKYAFG